MTTNHDDIIAYFKESCSGLIEWAESAPHGTTAYEAEVEIFKRIITIGALALVAFLTAQAKRYRWAIATDAAGRKLRYHSERPGLFYSLFGAITFKRSYHCGDGHGFYPMDAALNLPPNGPSDFLRKMTEELATSMSYEEATVHLAKYFPVATSTRAVQEAVQTDSVDAAAYYAQAPAPAPNEQASILAVQADCAGVPLVKQALSAPAKDSQGTTGSQSREPGRNKGPKEREGKMKMATAVSVSMHVPFVRTPEEVVESLFRTDAQKSNSSTSHHDGLKWKRIWATLEGKDQALAQAKLWVEQVDGCHIKTRLSLTDGERALQRKLDEGLPGHERILDFRHALGYLWNAADAWFGKADVTKRPAWVRQSALLMLRGKTQTVIDEMDSWATKTTKPTKWQPLKKTATYFQNNLNAMQYDKYLAEGWPIATGLIEGCCGHVIKGRCDGSGRRWTQEGAEAMLHLRSVEENGDWETYHVFRMQCRHRQFYGLAPTPKPTIFETDIYKFSTKNQLAKAV